MALEPVFAATDGAGNLLASDPDLDTVAHEVIATSGRHTTVYLAFNEEEAAGHRSGFTPNVADPRTMPKLAFQQWGAGRVSASAVDKMTLEEAHHRLKPFFPDIPQYQTPMKLRAAFISSNYKTSKAVEGLKIHGSVTIPPTLSRGPQLLPYNMGKELSGYKLPMSRLGFCVGSNKACQQTCLVNSGKQGIPYNMEIKLKRTEALQLEPVAWCRVFLEAIQWHINYCKKQDIVPYVRPNVLSDIPWELVFPEVFDTFPRLQFYDYTKVPGRKTDAHKNYDITFSFSGTNLPYVEYELGRGRRVAVVFAMPKSIQLTDIDFLGQKVIDGDTHDMRPLDPPGSVIGLKYKVPVSKKYGSAKPPEFASKFVVAAFRDKKSGLVIVPGSPTQLGVNPKWLEEGDEGE